MLGMVSIFWGNGKGKTSAALGSAVRALGAGLSVHLVQFMKNNQSFGEVALLEKIDNFSYRRFGAETLYIKGKTDSEHRQKAKEAIEHLKLSLGNYDIIIADEILYAVQFGLLDEKDVVRLIEQKPKNQELILTGGHIPLPKIFEKADLVTEMKKHKHYFDSGIQARKGIDI